MKYSASLCTAVLAAAGLGAHAQEHEQREHVPQVVVPQRHGGQEWRAATHRQPMPELRHILREGSVAAVQPPPRQLSPAERAELRRQLGEQRSDRRRP